MQFEGNILSSYSKNIHHREYPQIITMIDRFQSLWKHYFGAFPHSNFQLPEKNGLPLGNFSRKVARQKCDPKISLPAVPKSGSKFQSGAILGATCAKWSKFHTCANGYEVTGLGVFTVFVVQFLELMSYKIPINDKYVCIYLLLILICYISI